MCIPSCYSVNSQNVLAQIEGNKMVETISSLMSVARLSFAELNYKWKIARCDVAECVWRGICGYRVTSHRKVLCYSTDKKRDEFFIPIGNHFQLWPLPHTFSLLLTVFLSLFLFFFLHLYLQVRRPTTASPGECCGKPTNKT